MRLRVCVCQLDTERQICRKSGRGTTDREAVACKEKKRDTQTDTKDTCLLLRPKKIPTERDERDK